jgi:hypothetical protein
VSESAGTASPRAREPSAAGAAPSQTTDWRADRLDPALAAARAATRVAVGVAHAAVVLPERGSGTGWAGAELAVHHCLDLALDGLYRSLGTARPPPAELPADLDARAPPLAATLRRLLGAPDARARYVFLEDLVRQIADR